MNQTAVGLCNLNSVLSSLVWSSNQLYGSLNCLWNKLTHRVIYNQHSLSQSIFLFEKEKNCILPSNVWRSWTKKKKKNRLSYFSNAFRRAKCFWNLLFIKTKPEIIVELQMVQSLDDRSVGRTAKTISESI